MALSPVTTGGMMHQMSHPCVTMITTAPGQLWWTVQCGPGPGPAVTEIFRASVWLSQPACSHWGPGRSRVQHRSQRSRRSLSWGRTQHTTTTLWLYSDAGPARPSLTRVGSKAADLRPSTPYTDSDTRSRSQIMQQLIPDIILGSDDTLLTRDQGGTRDNTQTQWPWHGPGHIIIMGTRGHSTPG